MHCWIALEALCSEVQLRCLPFCGFCDLPYFVKHGSAHCKPEGLERINKNISIPFLQLTAQPLET
jgi:hypothetical protein